MIHGDLVNVETAAKALGISRNFLYRAAARGSCPFYRAGRTVRFSVTELREWMRQQATTPTHGGEHVLATHAG